MKLQDKIKINGEKYWYHITIPIIMCVLILFTYLCANAEIPQVEEYPLRIDTLKCTDNGIWIYTELNPKYIRYWEIQPVFDATENEMYIENIAEKQTWNDETIICFKEHKPNMIYTLHLPKEMWDYIKNK